MKISVVMPVYNAAEFLRESIGDILAQTFEEFELICVDDGSKDNSSEIIKEFAANDSRVKYLHQDNAGAGTARNRGMDAAKGKYLLFLDADDRFESTMLEELWNRAEETAADVVIFGADCFMYGTERRRDASWLLDKKYLTEEYIEQGVIRRDKKNDILYKISTSTVWNKLFRRAFIQKEGIEFQQIYVVDSMYFVMLAMAYAKRVAIYDKRLVHYRENVPTGQIMNHDKSPTGVYEALYEVKEHICRSGRFEYVERAFVNYAIKSCLDRLTRFSSLKAEEALYTVLHDNGFEKLGLDLADNIHNIPEVQWERCKEIHDMEYKDYLFWKQSMLKQMVNRTGSVYRLPEELLLGKKKVAVYGAGNVGKSYFFRLLNMAEHQVIGWFDKNYESCGYPVESPELLKQKDVDAVIIGVLMGSVADEISKDIQKLGIPKDKIFWEEPKIL